VDVAGPNNRADGIFQHVYIYRDSGHFQHIPISTVDVSNTFQYPQWKFPTLSNMNIGIFLYISLHIMEFSNILQHI
jgi:hypothetical protein